MASGYAALRKIQIGKETTKGTAVVATAELLGTLQMKNSPTFVKPADERANMAQYTRSVKVANMADIVLSGEVSFEQILYALHMGIAGDITPVSGDSNYIWTFRPSLTAAGTFDAFTLKHGDDVQAWEAEYCMASSIEFSGGMNELLKMTANIFARKMSQTTFTTLLSPPTVENIPSQMARIYIDNENGVIGTTEKSATLISMTLTINTGLSPVRYADGSIDFSQYRENRKGFELKMTLGFNSGVETERNSYHDGETLRLVRVEFLGDNVAATHNSVDTVQDDPLTDSATTLNVADGTKFKVGETILIDSEKLRVTAINTNALTVIRGVYGTTPASHTSTKPIAILNEKRLTLDCCGIWASFESLGERDGEDVIDCVLTGQLGSNYTGLYGVEVVNGVAALP